MFTTPDPTYHDYEYILVLSFEDEHIAYAVS